MTDDYLKTWRYFSSTLHAGEGGAPAPTEFLSLEEIHNNIHVRGISTSSRAILTFHRASPAAMMGRMATCKPHQWLPSIRYSSFIIGKHVPRFVSPMHEVADVLDSSNVDKQLAMWQTLNPTRWFDNLSKSDSGPTVPLTPFHKDTKFTMYTSNDCRDWTKLNYQYDDLENTPRCKSGWKADESALL